MDQVRSIGRSTASGSNGYRGPVISHGHSHPAEKGRALVTIAPSVPPRPVPTELGRPAAPFLAQLIASKHNLPQARERRRAEPHEAIAAYMAASRGA
jgi:hypothetical protein